MRSKSLAGHDVGLARLPAKLIAFWELALGVWVCHGFAFPLRTLRKQITTHASCDFSISRFRISEIRHNSILLRRAGASELRPPQPWPQAR